MPSPIVTATAQATALASISNVLAQLIDQYRHDQPYHLDAAQFLRFLLLSIITAPPNYLWQAFLERTFPGRLPHSLSSSDIELEAGLDTKREEDNILASDPLASTSTSSSLNGGTFSQISSSASSLNWRNTFLKWFTDCITLGALLNTSAFLIIMGVLKGHALDEIVASLRTDLFAIIWDSYKIWPIASVVNFTLVPVEKRIVFLSAVGLVWGVYMSLVAAKA